MSNDLCKKIVNAVQDTICKNTTPDFDKDGRPINVWEALPGYDEIKSVIEAQFTDVGEVSDGYHTFNELYHHQAREGTSPSEKAYGSLEKKFINSSLR